jgi:hypothetical protein
MAALGAQNQKAQKRDIVIPDDLLFTLRTMRSSQNRFFCLQTIDHHIQKTPDDNTIHEEKRDNHIFFI